IYNPEIVTDLPVVVVDDSRTASSRDLVRMVDATQSIEVYNYVPDMAAARRVMNDHDCFGILHIPSDYDKRIGSGEQAVVNFYGEMSLLLRYRSFVAALTDIQLELGTRIQTRKLSEAGVITLSPAAAPVHSESIMLGDPTQGFASFVIPGILVLILQQSLILGVTMLTAGGKERRRANGGVDPLAVDAPISAQMLGRLMCYLCIYAPLVLYMLHIVPLLFSLPQVGSLWQGCVLIFPMLIASTFLGYCLSWFVKERESSMLVIVFTSVVFLFLSGLTWPRYAMNGFWKLLGDTLPATWGVEAFVRMNSNGSPLWEQSHPYIMLWVLAGVYFVVAYCLQRYCQGRKGLES
ncbi:MAG: ABC transporter permease, partial [Paramuribaculum sp.]|nr:ABC transporter permease [Paramuribaculum sp.]